MEPHVCFLVIDDYPYELVFALRISYKFVHRQYLNHIFVLGLQEEANKEDQVKDGVRSHVHLQDINNMKKEEVMCIEEDT
jgi:hypothetical protein